MPDWSPRPLPDTAPLAGRTCELEALDAGRHAADLVAAYGVDDGRMWTYLPYGPFAAEADYEAWAEAAAGNPDLYPYAIVERASGRALGVAAYLRVDAANGTIEIGHVALSPALQRSVAATEALGMMIGHAIDDLGYRRCEWKCDALNAPSRRAALRLGFRFEGVFLQAAVVRGHNRDTAWYAITDRRWQLLRPAHAAWLQPANFDADGHQRQALSELTAAATGGDV